MDKSQTDTQSDIATETYKGPSVKVEAAGRGFLEHLLFAFSGLAIFGTLAFIFHQPAAQLVEKSRALGTRLKNENFAESKNFAKTKDTITNWCGGFLHAVFGDTESAESIKKLSKTTIEEKHVDWLTHVAMSREQGFGNALLSHSIGFLPLVGKPFIGVLQNATPRWQTAISVGGLAGALGYVGGWLKAAVLGAKHGNTGKRQFERAQAEIAHLRETNDNLNKINDDLHAKVVEVSTKFKDSATDISDTPKDSGEGKAVHKMTDIPAAVALHAAEHQGKLHAEKAAEASMA